MENIYSGSGEEDENVKSLQTDRETERRRTTGDQKSSLDLSAQVSKKELLYKQIPFLFDILLDTYFCKRTVMGDT